MNRFFIALYAILLSFSACKTTVHVHFNKDNSGYVKMDFDMSEFINNAADTSGHLIDSLIEGMKTNDSIPFIKNYKIVSTRTGIQMSYEFANIDDLNKSLSQINSSDEGELKTIPFFKAKRNKIYYSHPESGKKKEEDTEEGDFSDFFPATFRVSFEKKIVRCNNKNYTWNKEENYIEITGNLDDYREKKETDFRVRLK